MLLGFRSDITESVNRRLFAFPSFRRPSCIFDGSYGSRVTGCLFQIRGNTDLIEDSKGGYLIKPDDVEVLTTLKVQIMPY